jgi:hypothetical protein
MAGPSFEQDGRQSRQSDDGAALFVVDRQRQAAQIGGDLLSTERDLAFFVWAGLPQGLPVWFGDVNPPRYWAQNS